MVNIVVVCWNAVTYTKETLQSLVKSLGREVPFQLTIIDNGSTDNTDTYLKSFALENKHLNINIIKNKTNIGIGAAYNQGLDESIKINAEYTAFCNNDLLFTEGWLLTMKQVMDSDLSIAMLGPIVPSASSFYDSSRSIREVLLQIKNSDTPAQEISEFIGSFGNMKSFVNHICQTNEQKYATKLRYIKFPNAVSSCMVMTRTSVFSGIGFFANHVFKEYGGEDIDMCWTVLKMGYNIAVTHETYVHHFRGKSIKVANLDRTKLLQESNKKLYNIWKNDLINFLKAQAIQNTEDIPNLPEYWLINELKQNTDMNEDLNGKQ